MATSDAVKVERIRAKAETNQLMLKGAGSALTGVKDIAVEIIRQPVFALIGANVLIELLQRVQVGTGKYETHWVKVPDPNNPEMGVHKWQTTEIKTQLLSDQLGSTLQGVINTGAALQAVSSLPQIITSLVK